MDQTPVLIQDLNPKYIVNNSGMALIKGASPRWLNLLGLSSPVRSFLRLFREIPFYWSRRSRTRASEPTLQLCDLRLEHCHLLVAH